MNKEKKARADWYLNSRTKEERKALELSGNFALQQSMARSQAAKAAELRNKRLGRVQPVQMEGLFIAKEVAPGTLVLGFREDSDSGAYGVQLISFNRNARTPTDHGTAPFIGKYVRVTIEEIK